MIDLYIASSWAGYETILEFASTCAMIQRKMKMRRCDARRSAAVG